MNQVYLNDIAEISSGQGAPQGVKYYGVRGHPFVRAGSLERLLAGGDENSLEKINEENAGEFKLRLYPRGTILFAKSGMSATKDRVYVLRSPCYVVSHLSAVIPKKGVDSRFLKYWFKRFRPSQLIRDKSYPSIRLADIEKIRIPDLCDDIKSRIASTLETCESAIQKRKETNRLTDEFLKSTFLEMFGDPMRNHESWAKCKIGDLIVETENINPGDSSEKKFDYVDISSIDNINKVILQVRKIGGKNTPSRARQLVKAGDIIVSTVRPNLNAVAIVPDNLTNPIASTGFCILRVNENKIVTQYLFEITKSPFFITSLVRNAKGASYPAVTDNDVKNLTIPVPPLSEQQKFANIVQKVERLKQKQHKSDKELTNLFKSLMQRAFRGEL